MAGVPGPVRTCVGCRTRATKATLLRIVAVAGTLVPDPGARLPGRGASVHLDLACVALAEKRRAFPRALRLSGPLDVSPVREHVQQQVRDSASTGNSTKSRTKSRTENSTGNSTTDH